MTAAISILPLESGDVEALCSLAREIWRAHYPAIIGSAQTEYMLAQRYEPGIIRAELECKNIAWVVLREDDRMVAFASTIGLSDAEVKLDKLYVHPSRQRFGLGGLLVDCVCERARELGAKALILAVNKHNHSAIAAYRKHGFEVQEAVVKEIGGGFVMDDYVMRRRL